MPYRGATGGWSISQGHAAIGLVFVSAFLTTVMVMMNVSSTGAGGYFVATGGWSISHGHAAIVLTLVLSLFLMIVIFMTQLLGASRRTKNPQIN